MHTKQHGEGRFTNTKGKSKIGLWENGERIKWIDAKAGTGGLVFTVELNEIYRAVRSDAQVREILRNSEGKLDKLLRP